MLEIEEKYKIIAERLINKLPELEYIKNSQVRIAYLCSDEEKKKNYKTVYADCNKVNERYKWTCEYDFFIVVYEPNIINFTDEQIEILLTHELLHVGINTDSNELKYYVVPHDVEDFLTIISKYGLMWNEKGQ